MSNKICIAGKNRIAVDGIKLLKESKLFDLCVCPVDTDTGVDGWQPSLRKAAANLDLPVLTLPELCADNDLIILSLAFDRIIRTQDFMTSRFLNLHFSLLPAYKGCFTSIWPLYFNEQETGVTLHIIDDGIDTGDILDQEVIPLDSDITAWDLYDLYQDAGLSLLSRNIHAIYEDRFDKVVPQAALGSSYYSRSSLSGYSKDVSFDKTAEQVKNHVRAFYFPVYQTALFDGDPISVCQITETRSICKPGTIIHSDHEKSVVSTIDYDVILYKD